MRHYVSYLRVSTHKQGYSGLGIEAQRTAVASYLAAVGGTLLAEHVEVESGSSKMRPVLSDAIQACKREGATLLIAKLDRLARNVAFVSSLMEGAVEFIAVDAPYANRLMIHILAAFAEHEREQISQRTKLALAAAKQRGVILGSNGVRLAAERRAKATEFAEGYRQPILEALRRGARTLAEVASDLNEMGSTTRMGSAWSPGTVQRTMSRLGLRQSMDRR